MGRQARKISQTGLYHIVFRGISRQNIFEEDRDYEKIKEIIRKVKEETKSEIYAYCLMTNHVHMFIKESERGKISKIMSKILTHYALWYNIKYDRVGSLFDGRYKSEPIEDERYFLSLVRYIHQNALKAGIVSEIKDYSWSSYNDYLIRNDKIALTDKHYLLEMLSQNQKKAIEMFIEFNNIIEFEKFKISENNRKSSELIRRIIMSEINGEEPHTIKNLSKDQRNNLIKKLVTEKGISKSALERATGISRGTIYNICNK